MVHGNVSDLRHSLCAQYVTLTLKHGGCGLSVTLAQLYVTTETT